MGESDPLTLLGETLAPHLALVFMCGDTNDSHYGSHIALLGLLMAGLPLEGIVTFAAQDLCNRIRRGRIVALQQFWFHISPKVLPGEIVIFYSGRIYRDTARRQRRAREAAVSFNDRADLGQRLKK